jgi:hypothetical protein
MSDTTKCDVCGRTAPDINPRYSRRKRWNWFRFDDDSQGGSNFRLDVCESCWKGWHDFMNNRFACKNPEPTK